MRPRIGRVFAAALLAVTAARGGGRRVVAQSPAVSVNVETSQGTVRTGTNTASDSTRVSVTATAGTTNSPPTLSTPPGLGPVGVLTAGGAGAASPSGPAPDLKALSFCYSNHWAKLADARSFGDGTTAEDEYQQFLYAIHRYRIALATGVLPPNPPCSGCVGLVEPAATGMAPLTRLIAALPTPPPGSGVIEIPDGGSLLAGSGATAPPGGAAGSSPPPGGGAGGGSSMSINNNVVTYNGMSYPINGRSITVTGGVLYLDGVPATGGTPVAGGAPPPATTPAPTPAVPPGSPSENPTINGLVSGGVNAVPGGLPNLLY
jgi:hypothetical protein